ncbi:hypothetical protein F4776DRAFT_646307 [Hypoxylon sp. NC0597]|nr:hypothetical protein F4776DRAFT_646307 [Hypoxylon sp. NC0597]
MCLEVYVHNTSHEHDTRLPSIINPSTGYTVYSPFQEPYPCRPCDYTHVFEPISPQQFCPYHQGCCRLEGKIVCRFEEGTCATRVKYHHFVDKENGEEEDLSFLDAYLGSNPSLLFLAAWFFKAGVELALANICRNKIRERLSEKDDDNSDEGDTVQRAGLGVRLAHLSYVIACSNEALAQFAILWNLNSGPGVLPPRPGRHPYPEQNAELSRLLNLKVQGWNQRDVSQYPWPPKVELWEEFKAGSFSFYDDPSIMSWAFVNEIKGFIPNPPSSFLNIKRLLSPPEPINWEVFNPNTKIAPLDSSAPTGMLSSPSSALSPLPPPPNSSNDIKSSECVSDSDSNNNEINDEEDETDRVYPIEAIVGHRPRKSTLKHVTAFKVRWEGDWEPNQKETWQHKEDIAPQIIKEYWEEVSAKNRKRTAGRMRRRIRQQKGKY